MSQEEDSVLQVVRRAPQLTEHLMKIQRRATRRRKMWGARCDTVTALVGLSTPSIGILFSFAAAWSLCHTLYQRLDHTLYQQLDQGVSDAAGVHTHGC